MSEQLALEGRAETPFDAVTEQLSRGSEMAVQAAVVVAQNRPRNEDAALQRIHRSCQRKSLAIDASYSFPRGGTQVTGPTILLLRAIARHWGNIESGYQIIGETKDGCLIRAYAWDLENNYLSKRDHYLERKVQRSEYQDGKKVPVWVRPDPRDWREWQGNIGSRMERSCLKNVIDEDVINQAVEWAAETRISDIAKDPDGLRKQLIASFDQLNVTPDDLELITGKPVKKLSPMELDKLRGIWKAINDGVKTIFDYLPASREAQEQAKDRALDKAKKADPDLLLTAYLTDIGIPLEKQAEHVKEKGRKKLLQDADNWDLDRKLELQPEDVASTTDRLKAGGVRSD